MKFLILNGPNLNLLGKREPEIYGTTTYEDLVAEVQTHAEEKGVFVEFLQSNHEGDLVDAIQKADGVFDGVILNAAAYTHTSVALLDAIRAVSVPVAEVHLSDPDKRENFRKVNFVRPAAVVSVVGKGVSGYCEALDLLIEKFG